MPILVLQPVTLPTITAVDQATLDAYLAVRDVLVANATKIHTTLLTLNDARNFAVRQRDIMAQLLTPTPPSS